MCHHHRPEEPWLRVRPESDAALTSDLDPSGALRPDSSGRLINRHRLTLHPRRNSFGRVSGSTTPPALRRNATRRAGVIAGLVAGPFFLISVGLNTWASIDYLHGLGWEFVGGGQVPWPSSLARGPYGWAQVVTFVVTGLMIVILAAAVRDQLPRRRTRSFAIVLLALLGVALMLAAFSVDTPMLSGGDPETWSGWVHGIAFVLIIAMGVLAPLAMALAVRGYRSWRPIGVVSVAASALFVVFLILPWGNASFLMAVVALFAWIAAVAVRLAAHHS